MIVGSLHVDIEITSCHDLALAGYIASILRYEVNSMKNVSVAATKQGRYSSRTTTIVAELVTDSKVVTLSGDAIVLYKRPSEIAAATPP